MSATFWGVLIIFLASFSVLAALLVGLVRQLKGLASTLKGFQERVQPLADRIVREGAVAQDRVHELSVTTQSLSARGAAGSNGSSAAPGASRGVDPRMSSP